MNPVLSSALSSRILRDSAGGQHPIHSHMHPEDGLFLQSLIRENKYTQIIEVGSDERERDWFRPF